MSMRQMKENLLKNLRGRPRIGIGRKKEREREGRRLLYKEKRSNNRYIAID